jgi:hypothetical protein
MSHFARRAALACAAITLLVSLSAVADAGVVQVQVVGAYDCQDDGTYVVDYTITHNFGDSLTVEDPYVALGDSSIDVTVTPNPIPEGGTGTASVELPGGTMQATLMFGWYWGDGDGSVEYPIQLPGDCTPAPTTTTTTTTAPTSTTDEPTTTTTEATTTTVQVTTTAPPAPPVQVAPTFTG